MREGRLLTEAPALVTTVATGLAHQLAGRERGPASSCSSASGTGAAVWLGGRAPAHGPHAESECGDRNVQEPAGMRLSRSSLMNAGDRDLVDERLLADQERRRRRAGQSARHSRVVRRARPD